MASSSLHSNLTSPTFLSSKHTLKPPTTNTSIPIRCGPRSNRGPVVKGRILSTEAILAFQSLKRAYTKSSSSSVNLPNLTRLIKSDLLSILRKLLRQNLSDPNTPGTPI